jgi:hypothetical protein
VLVKMLRNPRMIGMKQHEGILYPYNNVPAIFDRVTWDRICAKLEHKPAAPSEIRLLSNIALCDICLNHLRASGRQWKGTRSRDPEEFSYRCRRKTKVHDDGACGRLFITGPLADQEVNRRVIAWISNRENVERLLFRYGGRENLGHIQDRINELTENKFALDKAKYNPRPGVPKLDDETFYKLKAEIDEERNALMRRMAVTRESGRIQQLLEIDDLEAEWHARPVQWRREILKLVALSIVIEPRGKGPKGQRAHLRTFDGSRIRIQFAE